MKGPVEYRIGACSTPSDTIPTKAYALQLLDVSVQTLTSDPLGAVRSGVIRCTAGLVPAILDFWRGSPDSRLRAISGEPLGPQIYFDVTGEIFDGDGITVIFCVYLDTQSGNEGTVLALIPTGRKMGEYKRVGIVQQAYKLHEPFQEAEIKEITII